jgi:hypothetical protein
MNSLNALAPSKKYRIVYRGKSYLADVIDWDQSSGILTYDGTAMMIFRPDELAILRTDQISL